jgi:hypothetical protein
MIALRLTSCTAYAQGYAPWLRPMMAKAAQSVIYDYSYVPDRSGNDRNATPANDVTWGNGEATLDGGDGFERSTDATLSALNVFTISAWINLSSSAQGQRITDKRNFAESVNGFYFTLDSGPSLQFLRNMTTTTEKIATASGVLSTGVWYHVVAVNNGEAASPTLYINGAEPSYSTRQAGSGSYEPINGKLYVGNRIGYGLGLQGKMTQYRIYTRAISSSEASALHAAGRAAATDAISATGLVVFYDFVPDEL